MGRPSKLTEELIKEFCEHVAGGLPFCYCCDLLEIHETTYEAWMKQGNEDELQKIDSLYSMLYRSVKKSYAQYIEESKKRIHSGTPGWQGTAWWLERTNNKFMPKQQVTADEDGKVNVIIGGKPKDIKYGNNK